MRGARLRPQRAEPLSLQLGLSFKDRGTAGIVPPSDRRNIANLDKLRPNLEDLGGGRGEPRVSAIRTPPRGR
jgi:hypothetical protein